MFKKKNMLTLFMISILFVMILNGEEIAVQPYSSGVLELPIRDLDYDTINFGNEVSLLIRVDGVYYTDGGSYREIYSIVPDTNKIEFVYKKTESPSVSYGTLESGLCDYKNDYDFFSSTSTEDSFWYNANSYPDDISEAFDTIINYYSQDQDIITSGKPIAHFIGNYEMGNIIDPWEFHWYRMPGFNTIFYGESKVSGTNYKFQVYSIDQSGDNYSFKFLWASDSLGNGNFKTDSLVSLSEITNPVSKMAGIRISGKDLIFPRRLVEGAEISIFSLNGQKVYFKRAGNSICNLSLPLSSGIYFCSILENKQSIVSQFIIR